MAAFSRQSLGLDAFKRCFLLLGIMVLAITALSQHAQAQPASCDPNYWESMKGKAWMEAQREISQNQNLIYKPDSVLEYTCFDEFLNHLAYVVRRPPVGQGALFSETIEWGTITGPNMTEALSRLVGNVLTTYVTSNFSHNYLGGRATIDSEITPVTPRAYACQDMSRVWQQAKCLNFIQQSANGVALADDFFNLSWFRSNDPRRLPTACAAGALTARWDLNNSLAINDGGNGATQYTEETFTTYADHFATTACPAPAIPTGVRVTRIGFDPYDEHVCINPGCAYTPGSGCSPTASNPPGGGGGGP